MDFPIEDWKYEVANGDTKLGYEDWCRHKLEADRAKQEPPKPADPSVDYDKLNRNAIMKALAETAIDEVVVSYNGSGDSGQIYDVTFSQNGKACQPVSIDVTLYSVAAPWVRVEGGSLQPGNPTVSEQACDIEDAVEQFCWSVIEASHGGWENGEGGEGTITFDVVADTILWTHSDFYIESNVSEHEL